jgi:hypothetical protein
MISFRSTGSKLNWLLRENPSFPRQWVGPDDGLFHEAQDILIGLVAEFMFPAKIINTLLEEIARVLHCEPRHCHELTIQNFSA